MPEILSLYLKNKKTRAPRGSYKLLQKQDNGSLRSFQSTSKTIHQKIPEILSKHLTTDYGTPRFFLNYFKNKTQGITETLTDYFKNKTRDPRDS